MPVTPRTPTPSPPRSARSSRSGTRTGDASWVAFAPAAVALYPHRPDGSPRNSWPATVVAVELVGQSARVRLETAGGASVVAEVTPASVAALRLHPGTELWAGVKATEVTAYPA